MNSPYKKVYQQGDHPRPPNTTRVPLPVWLLAELWPWRQHDQENLQCCKEQRDCQLQVRPLHTAETNQLNSWEKSQDGFLFFSARNIFQSRTSTGFRDEHIWVSIVDPPSRSPFTRAQRVSCCMSLLLCTMAINIAFWNIPIDKDSPILFTLGEYQSVSLF